MIPTPTLPSLLVGFSTTNFTRAAEPTLSWNQLLLIEGVERYRDFSPVVIMNGAMGRLDNSKWPASPTYSISSSVAHSAANSVQYRPLPATSLKPSTAT